MAEVQGLSPCSSTKQRILLLAGFFVWYKIAVSAQIRFNTYMKKNFVRPSLTADKLVKTITSVRFIVSVAILIAVATFVAWTYHDTTNPDRVFWGMVDQNLQTSAYTRHTVQKTGSQGADQIIQTSTQPQQLVYAETVFEQTGVDSARAVTENIGTPTHDYVRYTSIATSQKDADGKPLDFSKVLNIWGVTESQDETKTTGQLYNQAVLGVIPTGNLSATQRRALIATMKDQSAYTFTVTETKRTWPFGRPTYKFNVLVKPVAYITALKQFAADTGLNHLDEIQPSDYESAQQLAFEVSVDGWTHQMTVSSQSQGAKTEVISGRNLKKSLPEAPSETITVDELQTKLQSVQ